MLQRHLIAATCLILALALGAHAGVQPIVTTDLLRIRDVTSIDVARDGQRAVYSVRSIATFPPDPNATPPSTAEPTYKNQSHLFLIEIADANAVPRQITFGDRVDEQPRLSPDGKRIVFVRGGTARSSAASTAKSAEPPPQVWIIPVDGGEARQLTNFKQGCDSPQWSPDGQRVLVSSAVPLEEMEGVPPYPMERPKRTWKDAKLRDGVAPRADGTRDQIRAWLERNASASNPSVITRLEYQDELELRGPMRFTQAFLIDPDSSATPMTHTAARRITNSAFDHGQMTFMPDGQSIVYVSKHALDQHPDRILTSGIYRVNIDGSNDRPIVALEGWALTTPRPSHDGAAMAFLGTRMDEPAFRQTQIGLMSLKTDAPAEPVWLTDETNFASSVEDVRWLHTQPGLTFNAAIRGGFPLLTVNPGLVQPATLVGESGGLPTGVHAFGVGGPAIVYSLTTAANPCVLKVRDGRGERTVDDLNTWVHDKVVVMPTPGEITRPDGTKIQYWLMEPTNRDPSKKYPLALQIHGGPMAMWGPGEFTMWHEFQLLCSWGYGVVYSNPRGSGGYGYEFQKKNFQDWGEGPAGDVLAVVDQAALKEWVDPERLVVTGGSYAGYLTAWIVAHDNRFKSAVAQRGVYDFNTFFGEGNAWRLVPWMMGGNPYDARFKTIIDRNNPFTYVNRIKTPLLILHSSNDLRTGVSQSEMMYRALKELNRAVEYVRYPNSGHDLSRTGDPLQRMDRLNRIIEFFERFIENPRTAPVSSGQ